MVGAQGRKAGDGPHTDQSDTSPFIRISIKVQAFLFSLSTARKNWALGSYACLLLYGREGTDDNTIAKNCVISQKDE